MTHSYVSHDSFICVTWLSCNSSATASCNTTIRVTWLNHKYDMTHSYVWYDSSICVTWLSCYSSASAFCTGAVVDLKSQVRSSFSSPIYQRANKYTYAQDMTHSYVWHDSSICVTWLSCNSSTVASCAGIVEFLESHFFSSFFFHREFSSELTYIYICTYTYTCIYKYVRAHKQMT